MNRLANSYKTLTNDMQRSWHREAVVADTADLFERWMLETRTRLKSASDSRLWSLVICADSDTPNAMESDQSVPHVGQGL